MPGIRTTTRMMGCGGCCFQGPKGPTTSSSRLATGQQPPRDRHLQAVTDRRWTGSCPVKRSAFHAETPTKVLRTEVL